MMDVMSLEDFGAISIIVFAIAVFIGLGFFIEHRRVERHAADLCVPDALVGWDTDRGWILAMCSTPDGVVVRGKGDVK